MTVDRWDGRPPLGGRPPHEAQHNDGEPISPAASIGGLLLSQLAGWMADLLRTAGDRLYEGPDRRARGYGWQITVLHGGLARRYRDPRMDLLITCGECSGTGVGTDDRPCPHCSGTGRLTLGRGPGSIARSQP
jgi:hypothetical protein